VTVSVTSKVVNLLMKVTHKKKTHHIFYMSWKQAHNQTNHLLIFFLISM